MAFTSAQVKQPKNNVAASTTAAISTVISLMAAAGSKGIKLTKTPRTVSPNRPPRPK